MRGGPAVESSVLSSPAAPAADPSAMMLMLCQHFAQIAGNQNEPRITLTRPRQPLSLTDAAAPEKLAVEVEEGDRAEEAVPKQPAEDASGALVGLTVGAAADEIRSAVNKGKKRKNTDGSAPAKGPRPKLPKPGDTAQYREAVIKSKDEQQKFRVFINAKIRGGIDVDRKWATSSRQAAFDSALDKVDSFWAS